MNNMFAAFAMESDDYDRRVRECALDIENGESIEECLAFYDVEYQDVLEAMRYHF